MLSGERNAFRQKSGESACLGDLQGSYWPAYLLMAVDVLPKKSVTYYARLTV